MELNLNFLLGLLKVSGSANYLYEKQKYAKHERLYAFYESYTHYEGLTMHHLDGLKLTHPDIISKAHATHVFTGIEYGARAIFKFERTSNYDISGNKFNLKVEVAKRMGASDIDKVDYSKENSKDVSVKYYGDLRLDKIPKTFEEAQEIVKKFPELLTEDSAVTMKVQLLPLSVLDDKAFRLVEIPKDEGMYYLENVICSLNSAEQTINELMDNISFD